MKNLRRRFELFCMKNRSKGIPNLMLYITIGSAIVTVMSQMARNTFLYELLCFDRQLILQGQIWRLVTYPLTYYAGDLILTAISLFCYYSIGRSMESIWGTLRFNLFYLTGVVMMDIFCLLFGGNASVTYLNLSLLLSYATLFPDAQFLFFFIIPVRAWVLALIDLGITLVNVISLSVPVFYFPYNLYPLIALANYFLFFGKDVLNVIPMSWRAKVRKWFRMKPKKQKAKVIPFATVSYTPPRQTQQPAYTHKCTVCGRTDVSHPDLEFRYCSRCRGYYCYCQDHIDHHSHIE